MPPTAVIRLRSATETVVPTTCSINPVSDVIRDEISRGLFSSKKAGCEAQEIALHGEADIGDDPLAQPRNRIEANRRADCQHHDQQREVFEPARDVFGLAAAREAAVDDQLDRGRKAQRRRSGNHQGRPGGRYPARIGDGRRPDHSQRAKAAAGLRLRNCGIGLAGGFGVHRRAP